MVAVERKCTHRAVGVDRVCKDFGGCGAAVVLGNTLCGLDGLDMEAVAVAETMLVCAVDGGCDKAITVLGGPKLLHVGEYLLLLIISNNEVSKCCSIFNCGFFEHLKHRTA